MKSLSFNTLTLTNFLSVGSTPLEFKFQEGLNLITGYNRDDPDEKNGIGKSSICDGLFFALFNETIKDLKMGEIVNDKTKKNCTVRLEFSVSEGIIKTDYVIERGLKPSSCVFMVNGEIDKTLSSIPKTNKVITDTIGVSKELFKQSIVMSIGKSVSFFNQGKADKRKFIEGIFNLEIFSEMLTEARAKYNETKRDKEHLSSELGNERNRYQQYVEKNDSFEKNKEEYIEILRSQIRSDVEKAKEIASTLKEEKTPDELMETLDDMTERLEKVDALNLKVEVKLNEINRDVGATTNAIENMSTSCPTCHRDYDDAEEIERVRVENEGKLKKLNDARVDFANKKTKISSKKKILSSERDGIRAQLASIKSIADSNKTIRSHIATLKAACLANKEKIEAKAVETSDFSDLITTTKENVENLVLEYQEVYKENKIYDVCKFILSEEGVKSVIINQLKNLLNYKINEYLDELGSPVSCEFDEYFVETIYNKNGVAKSYDAFSGGESKRIDLAILLTFQDILKDQSGIDIRLGFYDEILDSSIDEIGIKKVLRILKDKSETTPTYIISHRGKMSDLIDNEIILEKHNDFTFLKEIK